MVCSIQGCEHQAAFLLDCEQGGAFLVCPAHKPKLELHQLGESKSAAIHVPAGSMKGYGGLKQ